MNLEQIAQQAMDYLDGVGVAADYKLTHILLTVITDDGVFNAKMGDCNCKMINQIVRAYPKNSPN